MVLNHSGHLTGKMRHKAVMTLEPTSLESTRVMMEPLAAWL